MKTDLYSHHQKLGAKIVDFFGWEMPLNYQSSINEHLKVRESCGIFDISHMGRIDIKGKKALDFIDFLCTNDFKKAAIKKAVYTVICREDGTAIDDAIVYKHSDNYFTFVANASNREKDLNHLKSYANEFDVEVIPKYEDGILALQGPRAIELVSKLIPEINDLKFMQGIEIEYKNQKCLLSKTGYTGEKGCELYGSKDALISFWEEVLNQKEIEVLPIGLAARDSLRLEMGFVLYGHELSDEIRPIESLAAWVVKLDKENFLGKEANQNLSKKRFQNGVVLVDRAIAREGCPVWINGEASGVVTSGGYSPTLQKSIALIMSDNELNESDQIELEVRNKKIKAELKSLPLYKKS